MARGPSLVNEIKLARESKEKEKKELSRKKNKINYVCDAQG